MGANLLEFKPVDPTVSVILPTFNRLSTLKRALASVAKQTLRPVKVIIVDDGSTDGTWEWLEKTETPLIRLRLPRCGGAAAARNLALAEVSGEYVAFLDSDDEWDADFLALSVAALESEPSAVLSFCDHFEASPGKRLRAVFTRAPKRYRWRAWRSDIRSLSLVVARNERLPAFDVSYEVMHDRVWYEALARHGKIVPVSRYLAVRHLSADGLTRRLRQWADETRRFFRVTRLGPFTRQLGEARNLVSVLSMIRLADLKRSWSWRAVFRLLGLCPLGAGPALFEMAQRGVGAKLRQSLSWRAGQRVVRASLNRWGRHHLVSSLVWYVTDACNASCDHCFFADELNGGVRTLRWMEMADVARELPFGSHITLTGGEPLLRADLEKACEAICAVSGVASMTLATHGLWPVKEVARVETLVRNCPVSWHVQVSLDGGSQYHDGVRGKAGAFEQCLGFARALKETSRRFGRFGVAFHATLRATNLNELDQLESVSRDLGVPLKFSFFRSRFTLQGLPAGARGTGLSAELPSDHLSEQGRQLAIDRIERMPETRVSGFQKRKLRLSDKILRTGARVLPCYAGSLEAVVYSDGQLSLCENTRPVGSLRQRELSLSQTLQGADADRMRFSTRRCSCLNGCNLVTSLKMHSYSGLSLPVNLL